MTMDEIMAERLRHHAAKGPLWLVEGEGRHGPWGCRLRALTATDAMARLTVRLRAQVRSVTPTPDPAPQTI
jgi:hypothetical protein